MEKRRKSALESGALILIVAAILVAVNALSALGLYVRKDVTKAEKYTLSKGSGHLLVSMKQPLEIDAYVTKGLPKLDAFVIEGGWPLFGAPQPYRQLTDQYKKQIDDKSLVIVAADTIGDEVAIAKEGRVEALVGQRPFEMGYKAPSVMIELIEGKKVADPVFTGLDECTRDTVDTCIQK